MDVNIACNTIQNAFERKPNELPPTREQFTAAVTVLHHNEMSHIIREWFLVSVSDDIFKFVKPEFWKILNDRSNGDFFRFSRALQFLYEQLQTYFPTLEEIQKLQELLESQLHNFNPEITAIVEETIGKSLRNEVLSYARSLVFFKLPVDFDAGLVEFFNHAFKTSQPQFKGIKEEDVPVSEDCLNCEKNMDGCLCENHLATFHDVIQKLYEMELFDEIVGDVPLKVSHNVVKKYIRDYCKGNFEIPLLKSLQTWLEKTLLSWLSSLYPEQYVKNKEDVMIKFKDRLTYILCERFAFVRMEQLFDIIIEFPDSLPALEDLKEVLKTINLRSHLVEQLKNSLETRLLHPGVNTADILTAYISAIKALRVLDTTGVVLQIVSEPVCKYLRSREDTVRCIIFSLREDSCGELACELMKGVPLKLEDPYASDEELDSWEKWSPDPQDADPTKTTETQRSSDIIGLLVNIYGSKELFVKEYRSLLADRILTTFSYNTEREIRYLELLKLRFGESQLHYCEVMLRDIADSKRINTHLGSGEVETYEPGDFPLNTLVLSAQFWPAFKDTKMKLPEYIWKNLEKYREAFECLKGNRTLVWKPHLGSVDLEIELKGRTLNVSVSPMHATILWHFQEKPEWSIQDLSAQLQVPPAMVRRKMSLWQNQGVLRETHPDLFTLTEEAEPAHPSQVIEEEEESVTASTNDMKEEEQQTIWSFIKHMLTNMGSLPLERIHSMLRMFHVQGSSSHECSIQDMKQFLDKKVRDRQLVYANGMFKLPKADS